MICKQNFFVGSKSLNLYLLNFFLFGAVEVSWLSGFCKDTSTNVQMANHF